MTLGRVIVALNEERASLVRVRWLTKVFVVGDIISFLLQCGGNSCCLVVPSAGCTWRRFANHLCSFSTGGGYMAVGTLEAMQNGENIVIAGLAIQLLWFGFFVVVATIFHWRVVHRPKNMVSKDLRSQSSRFSWNSLMWALYIACALILIRSIFRVVEFVQGNTGFIMTHEFLLYIFDALLMALSGIIMLVVFPGSFVSRCCCRGIPDDAVALSSH